MGETAIHENGISMKLCEICNSYTDFRSVFCNLFKNFPDNKEIEYMWFSGNSETGFGKPDITIRFSNGDFYFIEVKTKFYTEVQGNQELGIIDKKTKEKKGYIGLIEYLGQNVEHSYGFLVDQWHPGFEGDYKKIGQNGEYNIPVVRWNTVKNALKEYELKNTNLNTHTKFSFFIEDLNNNVDGVEKEENLFLLISDNEKKFLSSCSEFLNYARCFEKLRETNFSCNWELVLKDKSKFKFTVQKIDTTLPNFGWYIEVKKQVNANSRKYITYPNWLWIGFNTYLLDEGNIIESQGNKTDTDKFLFAVSVYGDLLSQEKLHKNNVEFCRDSSYWFYFPLENTYSELIKAIDQKESLTEIFTQNIKNIVNNIFTNYLPDNLKRINIKVWEK